MAESLFQTSDASDYYVVNAIFPTGRTVTSSIPPPPPAANWRCPI
ncbi:MAG: hypothetical protein R2763_01715 [Mycobacterium sp.]